MASAHSCSSRLISPTSITAVAHARQNARRYRQFRRNPMLCHSPSHGRQLDNTILPQGCSPSYDINIVFARPMMISIDAADQASSPYSFKARILFYDDIDFWAMISMIDDIGQPSPPKCACSTITSLFLRAKPRAHYHCLLIIISFRSFLAGRITYEAPYCRWPSGFFELARARPRMAASAVRQPPSAHFRPARWCGSTSLFYYQLDKTRRRRWPCETIRAARAPFLDGRQAARHAFLLYDERISRGISPLRRRGQRCRFFNASFPLMPAYLITGMASPGVRHRRRATHDGLMRYCPLAAQSRQRPYPRCQLLPMQLTTSFSTTLLSAYTFFASSG